MNRPLEEVLFIEYILRDVKPHLFDHDMIEDEHGQFVKKDGKYVKIAYGHSPPENVKRFNIETSRILRVARKARNDAEKFREAMAEPAREIPNEVVEV